MKFTLFKIMGLSFLLAVGIGARPGEGASLLRSGPMVGYAEMREAMLWVQTTVPARVQIRYWPEGQPEDVRSTAVQETRAALACTAHLLADRVEPGGRYEYQLRINGRPVPRPYPLRFQTLPLWQYRTDPPAFTFATGSCAYVNEAASDRPNQTYGGHYEIFDAICRNRPDFMLWLGDNCYLREPDWGSRTGVLHRYSHTRALPELQPLLGAVHHYAIWDDHDYGPNDSDRGYPGKGWTLEAFKLFWANPVYDVTRRGGITGSFVWGDVQFFLLDDRWFRAPDRRRTGERVMLGKAQVEWLLDALAYSKAPFKIVATGGQVLNPVAVYETYAIFPEERDRLLKGIAEEGIEGVLFLTGDRHHTVLSRLDRPGAYPLYDLTVSPFTAGPAEPDAQEGALRVPGTLVTERNFALLTVSGPRADRSLRIRVLGADGKQRWEQTIRASDLRHK
jgi:alkaline phosphatase D